MKTIIVELDDELFRKLLDHVDRTGITNINTAFSMITNIALDCYLKEHDE